MMLFGLWIRNRLKLRKEMKNNNRETIRYSSITPWKCYAVVVVVVVVVGRGHLTFGGASCAMDSVGRKRVHQLLFFL